MKNRTNTELISKKENISLVLLYKTHLGRVFLKILVQPWFTKLSGTIMNSKVSNIITKKLIKKYNINQDEYEKQKFTSYNDFFIRKKKEKYLNIDKNKNHLISPADSKLTVYDIKENSMCSYMHVNSFGRYINAKLNYGKRRTDKTDGKWKNCRRIF